MAAAFSLFHCVGLCGASPPGAVCGSRVQVCGPHTHHFHHMLCFLGAGFLSLHTTGVSFSLDSIDTLGGELIVMGASCALCDAKQPPWPPPAGSQEHPLLLGWQPQSAGLARGPSREGEVVTPAEERVLAPPPAHALAGVPWWVWQRALQCLHTWSQLLCLGCCLTGVGERNPLPPHRAAQLPAPGTGQAGKSREGTKAWLPSPAFLPEEKVFPQASN